MQLSTLLLWCRHNLKLRVVGEEWNMILNHSWLGFLHKTEHQWDMGLAPQALGKTLALSSCPVPASHIQALFSWAATAARTEQVRLELHEKEHPADLEVNLHKQSCSILCLIMLICTALILLPPGLPSSYGTGIALMYVLSEMQSMVTCKLHSTVVLHDCHPGSYPICFKIITLTNLLLSPPPL